MTLPANQTKDNFDQAVGDDPKLARQEFADNVDKFNQSNAHLKTSVIVDKALAIGDGLENEGPDVSLRVQLQTSPGLERGVSGIKTERVDETEARAGTDNIKTMTALAVRQAFDELLPTSAILPVATPVAPPLFILADGGTIGDAGSGASTRENADTEPLFTIYWDHMADSEAPVSGGRGGSASADFAAGKTIKIPEVSGRSMIGAGTGSGLTARVNGAQYGEEDHQLTIGEMPRHRHAGNYPVSFGSNEGTQTGWSRDNGVDPNETLFTDFQGNDEAHNTIHPVLAHWHIIKL